MLRKIWSDFLLLLLRRPAHYQVAALCWRKSGNGIEVLLVTSLTTRRWIIPKGWPKDGLDGGATAAEEAWEEAGIQSSGEQPVRVGQYVYQKRLRNDVPVPMSVDVYAIHVPDLLEDYPEKGRRERVWLAPAEAAARVEEPELKQILSDSANLIRRYYPPADAKPNPA